MKQLSYKRVQSNQSNQLFTSKSNRVSFYPSQSRPVHRSPCHVIGPRSSEFQQDRADGIIKLLRKDDGDKKTKATVVPKEATGKDGRANQVDVARRSYLEAATRAGE